jgi:tRNA(Ile)-lysidine synthase
MLGVPRLTIRAFLHAIGQPFREDETNAELTRTRARIRHDLLPKLAAEYNPAVSRALVRLGALSGSLSCAVEREASVVARRSLISIKDDCLVLRHSLLRNSPRILATEGLRLLWRRAGWPEASMSARRWRRLASLIRKIDFKPIATGAGVQVSSDGAFLLLSRSQALATSEGSTFAQVEIPLGIPGHIDVPWAGCSIDAWDEDAGAESADEVVDFDQVAMPLYVRRALAGDRFDPLGMGGKSMPLADFFRGRRVLPGCRARTPLVCDQRGIVWVAGHRIAERVKETPRTMRRLSLRVAALSAGEEGVAGGTTV